MQQAGEFCTLSELNKNRQSHYFTKYTLWTYLKLKEFEMYIVPVGLECLEESPVSSHLWVMWCVTK